MHQIARRSREKSKHGVELTLLRFSEGRQSRESNARGDRKSELPFSPSISASCDDLGEAGMRGEG